MNEWKIVENEIEGFAKGREREKEREIDGNVVNNNSFESAVSLWQPANEK